MNLAAWVAIYLILVLASIALGFFFGFNVGEAVSDEPIPRHVFPVDLDGLDRPTAGIGED